MAVCKLTGKSGKFVRSHLLPKALTRSTRPGLPLIQFDSDKRAVIRRDSWYDKELVTAAGEAYFADLDDWAIKFLRQKKLIWSGWGPALTLAGHYQHFPGTSNGIRKISVSDPKRLRLFFLSLLWRAGATTRPEFNQVNIDQEVLNTLGSMIMEGQPNPSTFFPISLVQLSTKGIQHNLVPIFGEKDVPDFENGGSIICPFYRFYIDGLIIHFDLEELHNGENSPSNPMILGDNSEVVLPTVEYGDSSQRLNLRLIMEETTAWPNGFELSDV